MRRAFWGYCATGNIVDVLDLTSIGGRVAVIMEYLEGADLRFVLRYLEQQDDRLTVRSVLEIGSAVASALDAAYNRPPFAGEKPLRVIHRDIKPNNIMLDDMGMAKVLDFGVARSELDSRESQTQELQFGSLEYMAPERLFFEPKHLLQTSTHWGATLFELCYVAEVGKAWETGAAYRVCGRKTASFGGGVGREGNDCR